MIICAAGDIHGAMDRMYEDLFLRALVFRLLPRCLQTIPRLLADLLPMRHPSASQKAVSV